ncbi:hypothetical protein B0H16DRAFT_1808591 [Mycena metata]|uniref:Uncharacterized protein n=1 Tax=Mycena metata TaxID=1033252 RepID=A0AAD7JGC2_9AGAR|nr:hypothetical protein B0H16DRAFT_1808591 [Mycena metata]
MPAPSEFLSWVDASKDAFIARLSHAVSIPSISGDPAYRPRVQEMSDWLNAEPKKVGVETNQVDLGYHVMDGQTPPAQRHPRENRERQQQEDPLLDGWASEPFVLIALPDGRLVGRGSSDDKGPVLGWFCFEGVEENGSEGLDELVESEREGWFGGVDCMCISDNYWLNTRTPALTYGLRGLVYFKINVSGPGRDLHSGVYGSYLLLFICFISRVAFHQRLLLVLLARDALLFFPVPALRALSSRYRRAISAFILARYRPHLPVASATSDALPCHDLLAFPLGKGNAMEVVEAAALYWYPSGTRTIRAMEVVHRR